MLIVVGNKGIFVC